jgi:hypothetical protein
MSNVKLAKKMYEDYFVHGDVDAVVAVLDPAIEWAEPELGVLPYSQGPGVVSLCLVL